MNDRDDKLARHREYQKLWRARHWQLARDIEKRSRLKHPETRKAAAKRHRQNPIGRAAHRRQNKALNDRTRATATESRTLWASCDEAWLLRNAGTMPEQQMARTLGRSINAVWKRLWLLRQELGKPVKQMSITEGKVCDTRR